ncbi:MAG: phosphate signaling complex protein PhoU [Chloroflexota bacterium]|jgi:phosphate transport system protein
MRTTFDQELQHLQDRLLALGSQVGDNIVRSVIALYERDAIAARRLIEGDKEVNRKRIEIMTDTLILIARQQPMAGDMRLIASVLEITGELERINDYSKGIARNSLMIGAVSIPDVINQMPDMAIKTRQMLRRALEAHAQRDAASAKAIPADDDEIDFLFNEIYRQILSYVADNPGSYELINYLEWALHNLERAADRVTNICEWVVYNVTGEYVEMDSEFEAPPAD